MDTPNPRKLKCYCNVCDHDTFHEILYEVPDPYDDFDNYCWSCQYSISKCCGCGAITLATEICDESDAEYDDDCVHVTYPVRVKTYPYQKPKVKNIDTFFSIPANIRSIYNETINALNNESYLLAAAGFRAIVESICIDKCIQGKDLENKINSLCKNGLITKNDRDRLHSIRFMGNDSIHSIKKPEKSAILLVLEIIHNMLNNLYILEDECRNILEGPIKTVGEFIEILDQGIASKSIGHVDILKNLIVPSRRLINEDFSSFEKDLIELINEGKYTKLSLCPHPSDGKKQQYKIESVG